MNWSTSFKKELRFVTSDSLALNYYICYFYELVGGGVYRSEARFLPIPGIIS